MGSLPAGPAVGLVKGSAAHQDGEKMIEVRAGQVSGTPSVLGVGLVETGKGPARVDPAVVDNDALLTELVAYVAEVEHAGSAGAANVLARPSRRPSAVVLVGAGAGDERGWRAAGAALVRAALPSWSNIHVNVPGDTAASAIRGLAEGARLASYRFRLAPDNDGTPKLRRVTIGANLPAATVNVVLDEVSAVTEAVVLARDLTNAPSAQKSPKWFADRVAAAATRRLGVTLKTVESGGLTQGGFGGILAVGSGSPRPPLLVELSWRPRAPRGGARPTHVVLIGKGITFDTGGISIKPLESMSLMRKDMAGAAAVCATVLAAADLDLPVRVTALAPLADNLVSGASYRPGDVIRHFGGTTTEVQNTDAEGRLVVADALAYAGRRLSPDVIVDLATLTGAARVALGKRTAALFTHNDDLAKALLDAGDHVGEGMWRLPLVEDYAGSLASDVADRTNSPGGGAGSISAALFLREFVGGARERWAHIDMSAPSWSDSADGLFAKGATGWGVRALVRWLTTL